MNRFALSISLAALAAVLIPLAALSLAGRGPGFLLSVVIAVTAAAAVLIAYRMTVQRYHDRVVQSVSHLAAHEFDRIAGSISDPDAETDALLQEIARAAERYEKELAGLKNLENYRKKFIGNVSTN